MTISKTRKAELAALADKPVDTSDIPELDAAWFASAQLRLPESKERLTVRFDQDIVDFFRKQGKGYQTRMNAVLRAYMDAKRKQREP